MAETIKEQVDLFFPRLQPGIDWDPARSAELTRREMARRRLFPIPDVTDPMNPSNKAMQWLKALEAVGGRMNSPGRDLYADIRFPAPNSYADQLRTFLYKLGVFSLLGRNPKPSNLRTGL